MINQDFRDMLGQLKSCGVEFLVVGAHALAAHGKPRATGDLDLWIRPSEKNVDRLWQALIAFGAPMDQFIREDFLKPDNVIQLGVEPGRIDLLMSLTGLDFAQAWSQRQTMMIAGLGIPILSRADLIHNKRATDRPKDRLDADELEAGE